MTVLVISVVCSGMFMSQAFAPTSYNFTVSAADISVVGGNSPVVNIYVVSTSATPWSTNFSDGVAGNVYACFDATPTGWTSSMEALTGTIPYDTDFWIVVEVSINGTVGYNSTSSAWDLSYVHAQLTCTDLSISADTAMEEAWIGASGSSRATCNFWYNNTVQVGHGETVEVTDLTIKGFW
ncbi:MAG: hypothetical protein U9N86_10265 [Bacteroidota bacterium]|nr:hypothetical protein [Bacteroidota bacterium]